MEWNEQWKNQQSNISQRVKVVKGFYDFFPCPGKGLKYKEGLNGITRTNLKEGKKEEGKIE